jgi:hypothetical protein
MLHPNTQADHHSPQPRSFNDYIYTSIVLLASGICGFLALDGLLFALLSLYSVAAAPQPGVEFGLPSLWDLGLLFGMFVIASGLSGGLNTFLFVWLFPERSAWLYPRIWHNTKSWTAGLLAMMPISIMSGWFLPGSLPLRMSSSGCVTGLIFGSVVGYWHWRWSIHTSRDMLVYIGSTAAAWGLSWAFSLAIFFQ